MDSLSHHRSVPWAFAPSVALALWALACGSEVTSQPRPELDGVWHGGSGGAPLLSGGSGGIAGGGTTTTTSTTTTSTGGGGAGGGTLCNDWGEPNDSEMVAYDFGGINDCDSSGKTINAAIVGVSDVDWYTYEGSDDLGCLVDPNCVLVTSGGVARICKFAECLGGGTDVTCKGGSVAETSPQGRQGCCNQQGFGMDLECSGISDDADMYIRVDHLAGSCVEYTLSFHY